MAWFVWALILWGSLASAAVVWLAGALSVHVELREELARGETPSAASSTGAKGSTELCTTPAVRVRAARLWASEVYRRLASGPRG